MRDKELERQAQAAREATEELYAASDDLDRATKRKASAEKAADEAWRQLRWHVLGWK